MAEDARVRAQWLVHGKAAPEADRAALAAGLAARVRGQLAAGDVKDAMLCLCTSAWQGHVEVVVEVLDGLSADASRDSATAAPGAPLVPLAEPLRVLHAGLLMRLRPQQQRATEIVEGLQKSRCVAAKVLCALVTFEWDERATAVDMLYKLRDSLERQAAGDLQSGPQPHSPSSGSSALLDAFGAPLSAEQAQGWQERIVALLVASYASTGDYMLAIGLCEAALRDCDPSRMASVLLLLARMHLQIGDVEGARARVEAAKAHEPKAWLETLGYRTLDGLVAFADDDFAGARVTFERLLAECSGSGSGSGSGSAQAAPCTPFTPFAFADMMDCVFGIDGSARVTLLNNLALCHLNLCDLSSAVKVLEDCLREDPLRHMHRSLVFNLCTLYDLAKPKEDSRRAKQDLRRLAQMLGIDSRFDDVQDLRLTLS